MLRSSRCQLMLFLTLVGANLWSQGNSQLKFYLNAYFPEEQSLIIAQTPNSTTVYNEGEWEIGTPSLALKWSDKSGHTHQLELVRLNFGKADDAVVQSSNGIVFPSPGRIEQRLQMAFRYAYQFQFLQLAKNQQLGLGIGLLTGGRWKQISPTTSSSFPIDLTILDAAIEATPYYQLPLFNRVHLEVSIPISFYGWRWQQIELADPRLTEVQQKTIHTTSSFLPNNWSFRLGLAVDL